MYVLLSVRTYRIALMLQIIYTCIGAGFICINTAGTMEEREARCERDLEREQKREKSDTNPSAKAGQAPAR